MSYSNVEEITDWMCWQAFHLGGPRFLPDALYILMTRLNSGRETAWDVDATLTATLERPERIRRMAQLRAEFYDACARLTNQELEQLLSDIRSGAYDELGPCLQLNTGKNEMLQDSRDESINPYDPA